MSDPVDPQLPSPPDSRDRPRVGVDEWVAAAEGRMERRRGVAGTVERAWTRLPVSLRFVVMVGSYPSTLRKSRTVTDHGVLMAISLDDYAGRYEHVTMEVEVQKMVPERQFSFTWHPYAVDPKKDYSKEPPTLVEKRDRLELAVMALSEIKAA